MQIERGKVLAGRYRIEGPLGRGGMGSVWRALDMRLGRSVAVKLAATSPTSNSGPGQARRRLRREAEALAAISEPTIARVYDLVEADLDVCLVMELVEGESLAARLNRQPRLPAAEALEIAGQCAQALEAAHRIGIVHRDVKPSNIMLGPDGVKVVDFGIAAHIGPSCADTTATMPRQLVGTAAYVAPERALGEQAGGAADFYSLGVVLYQMLAGHLPFRADESLAMLYAHTRKAPEPLPTDVPSPAALLCMRLLSKKPDQRPTTADEINVTRTHVLNSPAASNTNGRNRVQTANGAPTDISAFDIPVDVSTSESPDEVAAGAAAAAAWLGTRTKHTKPPIPASARRFSPTRTRRRRIAHTSQTSTELSNSDSRRSNHPGGRTTGRRAPTTLLAAVSSTAAALAAATAWVLLEQPASAGAASPVAAPTSTTAPARAVPSVILPPTASQSAHPAAPVSMSKPKPPSSHSAPTKGQDHKPAKHGGGDGGRGGGGDGGGGGGGD
jgi:serine/threonine-protein kinase